MSSKEEWTPEVEKSQLTLGLIDACKCNESWAYSILAAASDSGHDIKGPFDDVDNTPLHIAAMHGSHQAVVDLLEFNAEVNRKNEKGETALFLAIQNGHLEIAQELREAEAKALSLMRSITEVAPAPAPAPAAGKAAVASPSAAAESAPAAAGATPPPLDPPAFRPPPLRRQMTCKEKVDREYARLHGLPCGAPAAAPAAGKAAGKEGSVWDRTRRRPAPAHYSHAEALLAGCPIAHMLERKREEAREARRAQRDAEAFSCCRW